ncbi:MAG: hypothetical protein Q4A13_06695 [Fretibacterium sp.]|uniref:hypothetical protein n=1 Tax=Fretibacterium sp. OH1220_COT-178 TaxID=2491047 RepID=UPI000F5E59C5|nr:hypothetical protein [Fretibacterium sp. OH1220_COT-178]MDO4786617.1 hypothetical protein [Fretibacterium sp.]RRD66190.1 hypothetical protein EII26_00150 [Fretibacterium sp. OH1220_COT-178]
MHIRTFFTRKIWGAALAFCLVALSAWAVDNDAILKKWTRTNSFSEKTGLQTVDLKVTYYSAEYIEALVRSEAEKNLWTKDEMENYKYTLLKTLNLHESIAFHLDLNVTGVPMYAQPFDRHLTLFIGKKRYSPSDYDKRFNFKISGRRDGMVSFPRYDPKTGKDILEGAKDIRLSLSGSVSQATTARGDVLWVWDISKDNPDALGTGKAMDRLELDRLIKRMEKLNADRQELQTQIDALDKELGEVGARIDELQAR